MNLGELYIMWWLEELRRLERWSGRSGEEGSGVGVVTVCEGIYSSKNMNYLAKYCTVYVSYNLN
jgi:hypothetical protein